jgi:hypothetical protein
MAIAFSGQERQVVTGRDQSRVVVGRVADIAVPGQHRGGEKKGRATDYQDISHFFIQSHCATPCIFRPDRQTAIPVAKQTDQDNVVTVPTTPAGINGYRLFCRKKWRKADFMKNLYGVQFLS